MKRLWWVIGIMGLVVVGLVVGRPLWARDAAPPAASLEALPPAYFPWMIAILLGYACLATLLKRVYIRRYGWQ